MHETAIVQGLIGILTAQAARHKVRAISRVRVKVGRLRAVEAQQLAACFELFAEGTVAQGAVLEVIAVPVLARCEPCACSFEVARYRFVCPRCGSSALEVLQGQELYIESFDCAPPGDAGEAPVTK